MRTCISIVIRFAAFTAVALSLFGLGTAQQSFAQASSVKIPLDMLIFIPCANGGNGETVQLLGTLNIVTTSTLDANGCAHVKIHIQPQQLSGIGSVTGNKYQGSGATQTTIIDRSSCNEGCIIEENIKNSFRIIGQGPGNNLRLTETARLRINLCTNEITLINSSSSVECI